MGARLLSSTKMERQYLTSLGISVHDFLDVFRPGFEGMLHAGHAMKPRREVVSARERETYERLELMGQMWAKIAGAAAMQQR